MHYEMTGRFFKQIATDTSWTLQTAPAWMPFHYGGGVLFSVQSTLVWNLVYLPNAILYHSKTTFFQNTYWNFSKYHALRVSGTSTDTLIFKNLISFQKTLLHYVIDSTMWVLWWSALANSPRILSRIPVARPDTLAL